MFNLLATVAEVPASSSKTPLNTKEPNSFTNLINQNDDFSTDVVETEEEKPTSHVPIDWSLKTKIRLLNKNPIPGSRLKCNEEASGITG